MKKRFRQNSAFFQQTKGAEDAGDVIVVSSARGGQTADPMEAGGATGGGGPISEKGLINAFKRAKSSGVFLVSGQ